MPTLQRISTKHAVLAQTQFKADHHHIAAARNRGILTPVGLDRLPLDRRYSPNMDSDGMKRNAAGFEWDRADQATKVWWPQGLTTSSDASPTGLVNGKKWVAASWYSKVGHRSRISFANVTNPRDPASGRYRHVELVVPDLKHPGRFKPLPLHVGGISWVGNRMYVADTKGGLRVFDMRLLSKVGNPKAFPPGTAPYVLPQIGAYQLPKRHRHKAGTPEFSGLSLDRKHGRLISQEFDGKPGGVIASWPIDLKTGLLKTRNGRVRAAAEWKSKVRRMAGVLVRGDGFDIVKMGRPKSQLLRVAHMGGKAVVKDTMWRATQQLSWDGRLGQVWALGEMPGHRAVWHFRP